MRKFLNWMDQEIVFIPVAMLCMLMVVYGLKLLCLVLESHA